MVQWDQPSTAATSHDVTVDFAIDATGKLTDDGGRDPVAEPIEVSIQANQGTVRWRGESLRAFVYQETPALQPELGVFQGVAVGPDRWLVFWLYCDEHDALYHIFYETTDGYAMAGSPAEGTCKRTREPRSLHVELPASTPLIAYASDTQVFADSATLHLAGTEPGSLTLLDHTVSVYPFGFVDCSACGAYGGWFELHSLLWDAEERSLSFDIFYLFPGHDDIVTASYGLSLPSLRSPTGHNITVGASWRMQTAPP